jgi:hypothetical protein
MGHQQPLQPAHAAMPPTAGVSGTGADARMRPQPVTQQLPRPQQSAQGVGAGPGAPMPAAAARGALGHAHLTQPGAPAHGARPAVGLAVAPGQAPNLLVGGAQYKAPHSAMAGTGRGPGDLAPSQAPPLRQAPAPSQGAGAASAAVGATGAGGASGPGGTGGGGGGAAGEGAVDAGEDGALGKRKADNQGDAATSGAAAKKAKDTGEELDLTLGVVDMNEEASRLSSKYRRQCLHTCTDVPFLQYEKDGPRRTGPLVQHLQTLMARHTGEVKHMDNLAIDLLSLACQQVLCSRLVAVLPPCSWLLDPRGESALYDACSCCTTRGGAIRSHAAATRCAELPFRRLAQHMRTTIERLVEVSCHRSGRAAGFAALRPHKAGALPKAAASGLGEAAPAAPANGAGAAGQVGAGAHLPMAHADLLEQEAARRASAPAIFGAAGRARGAAQVAMTERQPSAAAARGGLGEGGGVDVEMPDAAHGGINGGSGAPGGAASAERSGADAQGASVGANGCPAGGEEREILLKDILYILEGEV